MFKDEINYLNIKNYKQFHLAQINSMQYILMTLFFDSNKIVWKDWDGNNNLGIYVHNKNFKYNIFAMYKTHLILFVK